MNTDEKTTLICLPFAGAGTSFFNEWIELSDNITIEAIGLPGREKRFIEPVYTDVRLAAEGICRELLSNNDIDLDNPIVLFGHSLGAVLAFEVAQCLLKLNFPLMSLIVSGSPDPWTPRTQKATGLDDDAFIEKVFEFSEYKHEALENEMMRELIMPALRADVEMHESYIAEKNACIDVPIVVLRGDKDNLVSSEQVQNWRHATSQSIEYKEMNGAHMFFVDQAKELLSLIEQTTQSENLLEEGIF
ncbi:thioesterase II family protein [Colwellia psychrerythraea]|uniref:Thioesterase n=1 Tax=Colwellia psychrerythraea TaxID=28229 RepID=A0A099K7M9_COLPS|nr:alpha/beta fold hydrolase [Colwellia psychrerythraea]KGJ86784.1 Thioesterase [Colwellia psychrerythraea]